MAQGPARGIDGQPFQLGGIEFVPHWARPSRHGSLTLLKAKRMVDVYRDLFAGGPDRPNVVELGISQGGSVALLALLADPSRLVALDIADEPVEALASTLEATGLAPRIGLHYGVDQADEARLASIVADEFGDAPLDVVVDDASHLYGPTRASFDVLFPRLRPGGTYVIEDWTWEDLWARNYTARLESGSAEMGERGRENLDAVLTGRAERETPISLLALELVLAAAQSPDVVDSVTCDEDWVTVRRGPAPLDGTFRLAGAFRDHYRVFGGDL